MDPFPNSVSEMRDAAPHREYQRSTQLAYYFFLALFPALLRLLAIASFFPLQNFTDEVVRVPGPFAPREMIDVIRQQMVKIGEASMEGC